MTASACPRAGLAHSVLAGLLAAACYSGEPPRLEGTRVDSAGRTIITTLLPDWDDSRGWSISREPVLSIGVLEGDDAYQLFRVSDAMRLPDGRIVLANAGTREVRIYGADGTHIRTVGGPGQGPSELGYPVKVLPDTAGGFVVADRMDLVRYDREGEFLSRVTFDRQRWSELVAHLGMSEGAEHLGDGRLLAPIYDRESVNPPPRTGSPYRPSITMVLADPASGSIDTLTHIGGIRQQMVDVGRDRPTPVVGPYAPSGRWHTGRDGSLVIYDGALPQVERIHADGRHHVLRWSGEPEAVTRAEIDAWLERSRQQSWAQDRLPELERGWAAIEMPVHKPHVTDAYPAAGGATWIRVDARDPATPARWAIFGPEGGWQGTVTLPGAFRPFDIGEDWILGVEIDPNTEIETLRLFAVKPPGSP